MKPIQIAIMYQDGSKWFTEDPETIRKIGLSLPKVEWKRTSGVDSLRAKYRLMVRELTKNTESGYSELDMHAAIKPIVMTKFTDYPDYFTNALPEFSTTHLNYEGWIAMIEQLKVIANDIYGYSFKP